MIKYFSKQITDSYEHHRRSKFKYDRDVMLLYYYMYKNDKLMLFITTKQKVEDDELSNLEFVRIIDNSNGMMPLFRICSQN